MSGNVHPPRALSGRDTLTPERILEIAAERGGFRVSAKWRDQWLLRRCGRLVRAGLLCRIRPEEEGAFWFAAVAPGAGGVEGGR